MGRIGLIFPGQGSQYIGMGQDLFNEIPAAKKLMNEAAELLGFDLGHIIFYGTEDQLKLTEIAQPSIFTVSAMYFEKFKQMNEDIEMAAGHSLGEYTALYAAGVISFEDGLRLVRKRGLAMSQRNAQGTMYAIMGVDLETIIKILEEYDSQVVIANINSKNQIVISGYLNEASKAAEQIAKIDGANIKQLNVSSAFHSPLMSDAKELLEKEIDLYEFNKPRIKVIPNTLGYATEDIDAIKKALKDQITGQVKWLQTILHMKDAGIERLYEIGPGDILTKLNKTITFRMKCSNLSEPSILTRST